MYMKEVINLFFMEFLKNGLIMFEMNFNTVVVMGYDFSIYFILNSILL